MSLVLTKLANKINFHASKALDDPEAETYAKEQSIQLAQDKAVAERKLQANADAAKDSETKSQIDKKAKELQSRSQFSVFRATGQTATGILSIFGFFILAAVMMYSGHLVANKDIGYSSPFRVLSFLYGSLFFIYHIPMGLYDIYVNKKRLIYYSFLPLSTYQPSGDLEKFFLGPFCYTENQESQAAKMAVEALYSKAFQKSQIKTS